MALNEPDKEADVINKPSRQIQITLNEEVSRSILI